MMEATKNSLNKESMSNGSVIQNFYDGANVFITGGTGEFACLRNYRDDEFMRREFHFSRLHGKSPDRQAVAFVSWH